MLIKDITGEEAFSDESAVDSPSFELLAPGWYDADVEECEVKQTKDGSGLYIGCKFFIPDHNRYVWENINIKNNSKAAEEIGKQQLTKMRKAAGIAVLTDTDQFLGTKMKIKLAIQPAKGGYEAKNRIRDFASRTAAVPAANNPITAKAPAAAVPQPTTALAGEYIPPPPAQPAKKNKKAPWEE